MPPSSVPFAWSRDPQPALPNGHAQLVKTYDQSAQPPRDLYDRCVVYHLPLPRNYDRGQALDQVLIRQLHPRDASAADTFWHNLQRTDRAAERGQAVFDIYARCLCYGAFNRLGHLVSITSWILQPDSSYSIQQHGTLEPYRYHGIEAAIVDFVRKSHVCPAGVFLWVIRSCLVT